MSQQQQEQQEEEILVLQSIFGDEISVGASGVQFDVCIFFFLFPSFFI